MAEGRSNRAIAARFSLTQKTVETHISSILTKLDLAPEPDDHRCVLAVRAWLGQSPGRCPTDCGRGHSYVSSRASAKAAAQSA